MKKELFKELNAHIRACDNKSMIVNTAYIAGLVVFYSDKSVAVLLRTLLEQHVISERLFNLAFLVNIAFLGYVVLYVQLWFRGWKVHYMNLLHLIWLEQKDEFGKNIPVWMKIKTEVSSFDNIFRLVPFFVNFIVIIQISYLYEANFGFIFWTILCLLSIGHIGLTYSALRFGASVSKRTA